MFQGSKQTVVDNRGEVYGNEGNTGSREVQDSSAHASTLLHVDSRQRDRFVYTNANHFRLYLPHEVHNVHALELKELIMPIVTKSGGAETEPYVIVKISAKDRTSASVGHVRGMTTTRDADSQLQSNATDHCFATVPLVPTLTLNGVATTVWRSSADLRLITRFFPPLNSVRYLEFTLQQRGNFGALLGAAEVSQPAEPYPLAAEADPYTATSTDNNWSASIEIVHQST